MESSRVLGVLEFNFARTSSNAFIMTFRFIGFFKYMCNPHFCHSSSSVLSRSTEENKKTFNFLNILFSLSEFKICFSSYPSKGTSTKTMSHSSCLRCRNPVLNVFSTVTEKPLIFNNFANTFAKSLLSSIIKIRTSVIF